jgi:hypothetical protein
MRSTKPPSTETIVANAGTTPYPIPRADTPKLDSVKFGSDEFHYMLAAYCFDAQRKLLYFCKAALPILDQADPEFRKAARKDSDEINNQPDWERRARTAEKIMLRLQRELGVDLEHDEPALKR